MESNGKKYTKIITDFFTKAPENIEFTKTAYRCKILFLCFILLDATKFSIGNKDTDDCTRKEYN